MGGCITMAISFKTPTIAATATTQAVIDPMMPVAISDLSEDTRLQKRVEKFNKEHVQGDLLRKLKEGIELHPVEVVREVKPDGTIALWLWHGYNRKEAHVLAGRTVIMARVRNGSFADARRLALTPNNDHGLKLTDADKARTFDLALDLFMEEIESGACGTNELARRTNLSPAYVSGRLKALKESGEVKKSESTTVVRNGKKMAMNTSAITGRKPNATVVELKAFLSDWVIDNYPNSITDTLTAIILAGDKAEHLYGQMEDIPTPHRQQDIIEAARELLNEEDCAAQDDGEPAVEPPALVIPSVTTSRRCSTLVVAKEPTLTLIVSQTMALRMLKLAEQADDTEIVGAVRGELEKVAK